MGQRLLDVRRPGLPRLPARLAVEIVALGATVTGGVVAVSSLTSHTQMQNTLAQAQPALQGIPATALAQFGIRLEDPAGHGTARITGDQARTVALPLGEGPQSDGWSIVGSPVLAFATYQASASVSRTCLCWAIELNSSRAIPCDAPAGQTAPASNVCDNHHLVELIDAQNGGRWLSVSGHGLG